MPDKITEAGCYDLTNDFYHGDCCEGPSLSSTGAKTLVDRCPAAFWWNSYLNPEHEPENKKTFDLGTAAHVALLEPSTWLDRVVIVDADSYRTKDAKAARDAAWEADKTPLLPEHRDEIFAMRAKLLEHPLASKAWEKGTAEPSYIWRDSATGVWLKCRPDFLPDHLRWIVDYKTTTSAHPRSFNRRVFDLGYFQSAAWYIDGVKAVTGQEPEEWWFVVQETKAPYLVSVFNLDPRAIQWGRIANRRAIDLFAECVATGEWPGYSERATVISLPNYAEFQLEERFEAGEFKAKEGDDLKRIVMEGFAP